MRKAGGLDCFPWALPLVSFHLVKTFLLSVGFKGNLSLLEWIWFFPGDESAKGGIFDRDSATVRESRGPKGGEVHVTG